MRAALALTTVLLAAPAIAEEEPATPAAAQEREPAPTVAPVESQDPLEPRTPPPRSPKPPKPLGQVPRGFALGVQIATRLLSFTTQTAYGGTVQSSYPALQGGIFAGYKISRVIIGLGFDIGRLARGSSLGRTDNSEADTSILFRPGVQVAIVRSADQRVEMFGELNVGLGHAFHEEDPEPTFPSTTTTNNFILQYQVGPGVRFWAHPHFAVSGLAGVQGDFAFFWTEGAGPSNTVKSSTGVTSIFASLQLLGVF